MPSYRRDRRLVFEYLDSKLAEARSRAAALGESAVELADSTLDMMVAREMRGDTMKDTELKDEIFLCKRTDGTLFA
jgi:cytochrome P450